jgi:hypothetical protein
MTKITIKDSRIHGQGVLPVSNLTEAPAKAQPLPGPPEPLSSALPVAVLAEQFHNIFVTP